MKDLTSAASYATSLGTVLLSHINEIATVIGVLLALATFFVNLYFRKKMLELAQRRGGSHGFEDGGH